MMEWIFRKLIVLATTATLASLPVVVPAFAVDSQSSDWPCVQAKVETLTSAQIWDGPPVDDIRDWWEDKEVARLVRYIISRRITMEEAEEAIQKFAEKIPEGEQRDKRLTLVFAGVLHESNNIRASVISGIEKFQDRQVARAKRLEIQSSELAELHRRQAAGEDVGDKIKDRQEKYDWNARVFKERQDNMPLACEIPVEIEQRAFALGRAIRFQMS